MKTAPATARPELKLGAAPQFMGVLNVTPDSFFDGRSDYRDATSGVARGLRLWDEGALIVDVGGISTRPGSDEITEDEEIARVVPVIRGLADARPGAWISVDTYRCGVARAAFEAGAGILNDISGLTFDPALAEFAARADCPVILGHAPAKPKEMQNHTGYGDVWTAVLRGFEERIGAFERAGGLRERLILDPGIGFGKTPEQNLALIREIRRLRPFGLPVLVGLSRKSFIARIASGSTGPDERLAGSLAGALYCAREGVDLLRVHDVAETRQAIEIDRAIRGNRTDG